MEEGVGGFWVGGSNQEIGLASIVFFCFFNVGPPKKGIFFDHLL